MMNGLWFFMGSMGLVALLGLALFILWIWAIVDVIKSDFKDQMTKLIWIALLIFLPFIGAILYPFVGKNSKQTKE